MAALTPEALLDRFDDLPGLVADRLIGFRGGGKFRAICFVPIPLACLTTCRRCCWPHKQRMTEIFHLAVSPSRNPSRTTGNRGGALSVLRHGRLHRYNVAAGELGETALLEQEFAAQMGAKYCLGRGLGRLCAGHMALRAVGVGPGDPVLTNAFTLAPVPGSIASVGSRSRCLWA